MDLSMSRVQHIQHLSSALYVCLSFVCPDENTTIFVLDFSYSLSFFFLPLPIDGSGLPHPWIFHFEIIHNINKYI